MLRKEERKFYQVKDGQTLLSVAAYLGVTPYRLAAENHLTMELFAGQVLRVPPTAAMYTVQAGDTKALLCGSAERYERQNGTKVFYPGMCVHLSWNESEKAGI